MSLFARLHAWFVSLVRAPELAAREPIEVDVVLDENDLFETPTPSGIRLKSGAPAWEDEITRPVDVRELRAELEAAAAGRRR